MRLLHVLHSGLLMHDSIIADFSYGTMYEETAGASTDMSYRYRDSKE